MALNLGPDYCLSRNVVAFLNNMAARARVLDSTIPNLFNRYTIDRWAAATIDQMATAIANADGLGGGTIFGRQFHTVDRRVTKALSDLDDRLVALGLGAARPPVADTAMTVQERRNDVFNSNSRCNVSTTDSPRSNVVITRQPGH